MLSCHWILLICKANSALAISQATSFLRMDGGAIEDRSGNEVEAVLSSDAAEANVYVVNTTKPTLDGFDLNQNTIKIMLRFSETIGNQLEVNDLQALWCCFHSRLSVRCFSGS
jgi:hypothetical protein